VKRACEQRDGLNSRALYARRIGDVEAPPPAKIDGRWRTFRQPLVCRCRVCRDGTQTAEPRPRTQAEPAECVNL